MVPLEHRLLCLSTEDFYAWLLHGLYNLEVLDAYLIGEELDNVVIALIPEKYTRNTYVPATNWVLIDEIEGITTGTSDSTQELRIRLQNIHARWVPIKWQQEWLQAVLIRQSRQALPHQEVESLSVLELEMPTDTDQEQELTIIEIENKSLPPFSALEDTVNNDYAMSVEARNPVVTQSTKKRNSTSAIQPSLVPDNEMLNSDNPPSKPTRAPRRTTINPDESDKSISNKRRAKKLEE